MKKRRGRFVVLEGADGCGKSTQAARLVRDLRRRGLRVLHVRDPGSTPLSEAVRRILLAPATGRLTAGAEASLYAAARAQLLAEVVEPALTSGTFVVCERWTLSTEVYQGIAAGLGAPNVRRLVRIVCGELEPDLTIVLDVPASGGLSRIARTHDRMEGKGAAFHADVARAYRRLARRRAKCVLIPSGDESGVAARVAAEVDRLAG